MPAKISLKEGHPSYLNVEIRIRFLNRYISARDCLFQYCPDLEFGKSKNFPKHLVDYRKWLDSRIQDYLDVE